MAGKPGDGTVVLKIATADISHSADHCLALPEKSGGVTNMPPKLLTPQQLPWVHPVAGDKVDHALKGDEACLNGARDCF